MAICRAEQLIAEAMDSPNSASPTLRELAATARVSTNHFIRSFRQMRGTTPHQLVMTRRCQLYGRAAHAAAMREMLRIFPDIHVHTPYPIQFGDGDWITVVTHVT